jgi:hypothetical protein
VCVCVCVCVSVCARARACARVCVCASPSWAVIITRGRDRDGYLSQLEYALFAEDVGVRHPYDDERWRQECSLLGASAERGVDLGALHRLYTEHRVRGPESERVPAYQHASMPACQLADDDGDGNGAGADEGVRARARACVQGGPEGLVRDLALIDTLPRWPGQAGWVTQRYELGAVIGSGGEGKVYRATLRGGGGGGGAQESVEVCTVMHARHAPAMFFWMIQSLARGV